MEWTAEFILSPEKAIERKWGNLGVWKKYVRVTPNRVFASPIREDRNPSCSLFKLEDKFLMHDFSTGETFSVYSILSILWGYSKERVYRNLWSEEEVTLIEGEKEAREIRLLDAPLDLKWWADRGVGELALRRYRVGAAKYYTVDDEIKGRATSKNPIFYFKMPSGRIKIYRPCETPDKKWRGNCTGEDVAGLDLLLGGTVVFLTKSVKDCMVLDTMGFPSVCLMGEAYGIGGKWSTYVDNLIKFLKKKYRYTFILYDNDTPGRKASSTLLDRHKKGKKDRLYSVEIPQHTKCKDISDLFYHKGGRVARRVLRKLIRHAIH